MSILSGFFDRAIKSQKVFHRATGATLLLFGYYLFF